MFELNAPWRSFFFCHAFLTPPFKARKRHLRFLWAQWTTFTSNIRMKRTCFIYIWVRISEHKLIELSLECNNDILPVSYRIFWISPGHQSVQAAIVRLCESCNYLAYLLILLRWVVFLSFRFVRIHVKSHMKSSWITSKVFPVLWHIWVQIGRQPYHHLFWRLPNNLHNNHGGNSPHLAANRSNDSALEGHWILAKDTISPTSKQLEFLLLKWTLGLWMCLWMWMSLQASIKPSTTTILFSRFSTVWRWIKDEINLKWHFERMIDSKWWWAWIALIASDHYSDHHTKIA